MDTKRIISFAAISLAFALLAPGNRVMAQEKAPKQETLSETYRISRAKAGDAERDIQDQPGERCRVSEDRPVQGVR
jgi:hypothetical protein